MNCTPESPVHVHTPAGQDPRGVWSEQDNGQRLERPDAGEPPLWGRRRPAGGRGEANRTPVATARRYRTVCRGCRLDWTRRPAGGMRS